MPTRSSSSPEGHHSGAPQPGQASHGRHGPHEGHQNHEGHGGHTPEAFRDRLALSVLLTLPILYFSEAIQAWFGYQAATFPGAEWVAPVAATVVYLYGGAPFLGGARHELAARQPAMMTLIALAITVAYAFSLTVALGFPGTPFFWELATLVDVMLLGHWMEMASVQNANRALSRLAELLPARAHRYTGTGDRTEEVPVDALQVGDRILVRPGEQVPADGTVLDGRSSIDASFLTGESRPVDVAAEDELAAGSVNAEGALTMRVDRVGGDTTLHQMMRLVEEAQSSRGHFQNLADRVAGGLTYVALGAALLTVLAWTAAGADPTRVVALAVTVLVIACPHALGLAIPLVTVNATALGARHGILVRNRDAFERARDLRFLAFDKTGTLTEGVFEVRAVHVDPSKGLGEDEARRVAASLESRSEHPLGRAIVEAAGDAEPPPVTDFEPEAGRGVRGTVEGRAYRIGRPEWARERGIPVPDGVAGGLREAEARGESVVLLFDDARVHAAFALGDRVRASAQRAVARLQEAGVTPVMITGDAEAVARSVAFELGIERFHARVLPQDKVARIRELKAEGPTGFVGDGINDAAALLEADVGLAIGAGTNVAIESADLVLLDDDPMDAVSALVLSRLTYRKMRQNLAWAVGYNAIALPLAAGVLAPIGFLLSPAVGALLMSASTVIVAVNAMGLRNARLAPS